MTEFVFAVRSNYANAQQFPTTQTVIYPNIIREDHIMDNFQFYSPTEFVFGRDTESKAGEMVKKYGGT